MSNFIHNHRKATIIGTAVGLLLTAGIAWAIYLLVLSVTGNLGPGASAAWEFTAKGSQDSAQCGSGTGTVTYNANGSAITLAQSGQFPNDGCNFNTPVQTKGTSLNTGDLKLLGVFVNGSMPASWSLKQDPAQCGKVIPKALNTTTPGNPTEVAFRLETSGTSTVGVINAEVRAVPAQQFTTDQCAPANQ